MKIAILGSGGREHALALQISKSPILNELYCLPGNAGTSLIAKNIDINIDDFEKIYDFVKTSGIDLVIVGPEKPLVNGIVNFLEKKKILKHLVLSKNQLNWKVQKFSQKIFVKSTIYQLQSLKLFKKEKKLLNI